MGFGVFLAWSQDMDISVFIKYSIIQLSIVFKPIFTPTNSV